MQKFHGWLGRFTIVLAGLLVVAVATFGCGVAAAEPTVVSSVATVEPSLIRLIVKADYDPAESVEEMFDESTVVVFGRVTRMVDQFNSTQRYTGDRYNLGRVYEIEVAEYLRGEGPDTITFLQTEAYFKYRELTDEALAAIHSAEADDDRSAPVIGANYVYFLNDSRLLWGHHWIPVQPHRVKMTDELATVEGHWGSGTYFSPQQDVDGFWMSLREHQTRFAAEDAAWVDVSGLERVHTVVEYPHMRSLEEMFETASVVVVGRAIGIGNQINTAAEEMENFYRLARVYSIQVSEFLKGANENEDHVSLVQDEATFTYDVLTDEAREEINFADADFEGAAPTFGEEYVFFLGEWSGPEGLHVPAARAYRYRLSGDDAIPEGNHADATQFLDVMGVEEFWAEMELLMGSAGSG